MANSSAFDLPALAFSLDRSGRLGADTISLGPVWRCVVLFIALSLPVLGSAIADRFPRENAPRAVRALAVPYSPLGGTARKPATGAPILGGRPARTAAR